MSISSTCVVEGCAHSEYNKSSHGYCCVHYGRFRRYGDPTITKYGRISADHPLRQTWAGMKHRCYRPENKDYKNYGGRGIKICDRWMGANGLENFIDDMGDKPTPKHSIDRIDNDGDYTPENCRWATSFEQRHNRRPLIKRPQML